MFSHLLLDLMFLGITFLIFPHAFSTPTFALYIFRMLYYPI